jgi:phospholipid/cholesterol/gamma-HCH transport system substrate-binding protein
MAKKTTNQVKLGLFVMAGLAFLILLLYIIGKNQNLFGKTFVLKARFENVHGLMRGNNIRFGGIDAGTVSSVDVLNDTTIEVTLLVKSKLKKYIHTNATVAIGTDGLMGNKILNIVPGKTVAPLVKDGDVLFSSTGTDTDAMLKVLDITNNDVSTIAKELKKTVLRINNSKAIWAILNDESLPENLRLSLTKVKTASTNLNEMLLNINGIVTDVRKGKGTVGELLTDTSTISNFNDAIQKIRNIGTKADSLSSKINLLVTSVDNEINNGKGTVNALLKDEEMKNDLAHSLKDIQQSAKSFNQTMEAVKRSFLFRGYFKKQAQKSSQKSSDY